MANFYDWIQDGDQARRIVELPGNMRAVDTFSNGTITREIGTPSGIAKSTLATNAVLPAPQAKVIDNTAVVPAATPNPLNLPKTFLPETTVRPSTVSKDYTPHQAMPTAPNVDDQGRTRIGGPTLPRMFNPLAWDVRGSTGLLSSSEQGASDLQKFLKARGANRFTIPGDTGTQYVSGKDERELATNWVNTMKQARYKNDKKALSHMAGLAQELFTPLR